MSKFGKWQSRFVTMSGAVLLFADYAAVAAQPYQSHAPLHPLPPPAQRELAKGPAFYVDPARGKDDNPGAVDKPWRTINHALPQLKPGDTLYLRGGVYHENVYCAVEGATEAPITIRAYPGEQAILDGGLSEFLDDPANVWEPYPSGGPGEYRSRKAYKNIRDVLGLFGDSHIGLQTYWHAMDLRAENEQWIADPDKKIMVKPVYCGPGLWYDRKTGYIHARLAHTHIPNPAVQNYAGETDPRKMPLVISPFDSTPLTIDLARHVRFQDLVIRGGYNTVVLRFGVNIEFDNVLIYAGSYGIYAKGTGPFRMVNSAIYGMIPPWAFRTENSLFGGASRFSDPYLSDLPAVLMPAVPTNQTAIMTPSNQAAANMLAMQQKTYSWVRRPPANSRNIARLPTHAPLVVEGIMEWDIFAYPVNHDWEIGNCEFADCHDGPYICGYNIRFHHNLLDNMHDDAIYLSSMVPFESDEVHVYQNVITRCLSAFGFRGDAGPEGRVYIYRNIVDMRMGVNYERPTPEKPAGVIGAFNLICTHGIYRRGVESLYFYQNTFLIPTELWSGGLAFSESQASVRRVFNNMFIFSRGYGCSRSLDGEWDIQIDGNLCWSLSPDTKPSPDYLDAPRACKASVFNKQCYPAGWEANSLLADPRFVKLDAASNAKNDYRLREDSPARARGVVLPAEWSDPLRPKDGTKPDIGAVPFGSEPLRVGRNGRFEAGLALYSDGQ